ncbi:MAG: hypothetical protein ACK583_06825 [Cyanobacteriota bacterium]
MLEPQAKRRLSWRPPARKITQKRITSPQPTPSTASTKTRQGALADKGGLETIARLKRLG